MGLPGRRDESSRAHDEMDEMWLGAACADAAGRCCSWANAASTRSDNVSPVRRWPIFDGPEAIDYPGRRLT